MGCCNAQITTTCSRTIYTVRKRSWRRLCFYICLSVILFLGGGELASHHTLGRGVGFPACIGKEGRGLHPRGEGLHPGGEGLHPEGVCIQGEGRGSASRRGGSTSGGSRVCIRDLHPGELGKPLPFPKIHGILWDMVN